MALYEVILQQTYFGQEIINRWNYISQGTPAAVTGSFALTSALGAIFDITAVPPAYPPDHLMRLIAGAQANDVVFDFVSVRNLYSVTDFYETPFLNPLTGTGASESLSPINAFGFRTNRVRTDIRRGTKRLVGVTADTVQDGGVLTPTTLTAILNPIAAKMSEVLEYNDEGNALTFTPAIFGRERYLPNPELPDRPAYRYYPTEVEQLEHVATGILWDVYPQVRSQTSRQYGKGR